MKPPTPESILKHDIRLALGAERDLVLWNNPRGFAIMENRRVKFGLCPGASDLLGILAPAGRWFCLEIKVKKNKPTDDQKMFLALIRAKGGFACAVWSVAEARSALDRAREGLSQ